MKRSLRFITHTIAFLLALVFITSATVNAQSCFCETKAPFSSSTPDTDDQKSDDDVILVDHKNVEAFAYSIFIPLDPLPLIGHSIPPLQRPPRS